MSADRSKPPFPSDRPPPADKAGSGKGLAAGAGLFATMVLLLGRAFPHSPVLQDLLWPCPLKMASGVPCPTCGITRVAVHLGHGEWLQAAALAPLPTIGLLFCLGLGVAAAVATIRRASGPDWLVLWCLTTTPGRLLSSVVVLCLYGWTLVRFAQTGAP